MQVHSLGYRTDLALLELAGSEIEDRGDHLVIRTPANPRFYWGNFMLLEQPPEPEAIDELLTRFDATFPHSRHRALGFSGTADLSTELAPLVSAGLKLNVANWPSRATTTSIHPLSISTSSPVELPAKGPEPRPDTVPGGAPSSRTGWFRGWVC